MKVKVVKCFVDKYTLKHNKVGDVIDVTKKRFDEIQSVDNLVEKVEEVVEKVEETTEENEKE